MSTALNLVYQYRKLLGKCESKAGLDIDEIETLSTIEALFSRRDRRDTDLWSCRREFLREAVDLGAWLRGPRVANRVRVVNLGPGGMVVQNAPYLEKGDLLEIVIDDQELSLSYRFKVEVSWRRPDLAADYDVGLRLVGAPLLLRYGPKSYRESEVDDVVAAA